MECLLETGNSQLFTVTTLIVLVVCFFILLGYLILRIHRKLCGNYRYQSISKTIGLIMGNTVAWILVTVIGVVLLIGIGKFIYLYVLGIIDIYRCLNG